MKLHRIQALLLKYWYISINSFDRIIDMVYWPFLGIVTFGFTTLYLEKVTDLPFIIVYFIGGMILWTLFERVQQDVGTFILEDFWSRNIANTFVTPLKASELFASVCIIGLIRSIISFIVMFCIAFFAYHFNIFAGNPLTMLFVIPLFLFAWAIGILISGIIFRYGTRIQVFAWSITYLIQPLAAIWYPLDTLPVFLQKISLAMPLSYVFEGFRAAYQGSFPWNLFFIALGLSFAYLLAGYLYFVYCIKKARKTGVLTRY